MSGCSLDEAFPEMDTAGRAARKEERAKAKRCGGPALAFLKARDEENSDPGPDPFGSNLPKGKTGSTFHVDPDRQAQKPLPPPEKMNKSEGFVSELLYKQESAKYTPKHKTTEDMQEEEIVSSLVGQRVNDVIGKMPRATTTAAEIPALIPSIPSYFGKPSSDVDERFADFSKNTNDNTGYQVLGAGYSTFGLKGLEKAAGSPTLPIPSINDVWKPLTPTGSRSAFFDGLPAPGGEMRSGSAFSKDEKELLLKKLDILFARLEELESKRNEYAHTEISLFILSGLFLMFGLESVRKMKN
jgi:hypothetical protein